MKQKLKMSLALAMVAGSAITGCQPEKTEALPNRLPQDVVVSCPLNNGNSWFEGDSVVENGKVLPANSVTFDHANNCAFYNWAAQMFLWVTSPMTSGTYVPGNTVMESPTFYTVQPDTNNNGGQNRILVQNMAGKQLRAVPQMKKSGPNRLPVIFDKRGRMFEVEMHSSGSKMLTVMSGGKQVKVHHVEKGAGGLVTFFDEKNQAIASPAAILQHALNKERIVHGFLTTDGSSVYIDGNSNLIETETGQATNDVLVANNGSMVYYILFVNDVYAYYQAGVSAGLLDSSKFPTTAGELSKITDLARNNGVTLADSNALAIEMKTSWVEAVNLPDSNSYITTYAVVPVYKKVGDAAWVLSGEKLTKLALIGAHVVGSVAGHPEMVWATFEHEDNAPNAAYKYVDVNGKVKMVPQDTGSNWLLSNNASDPQTNVSHQHWSNTSGDTIVGTSGELTACNVLRTMPWGSAMDSLTNQEDTSSAASNSEVISLNNQVYKLLKGNDIRKNYQLIGATWTFGGAAPNGATYGSVTTPGVSIGTNVCANSTMETFFQAANQSCFTCHSGNNSLSPTQLSHIFSNIVPIKLASVPPALKK